MIQLIGIQKIDKWFRRIRRRKEKRGLLYSSSSSSSSSSVHRQVGPGLSDSHMKSWRIWD
jgi:hypothetical protein